MKKGKIAVLVLLVLLCFNVNAERFYKIELVIFSQNMPNSEVFDQTESMIEWPGQVVQRSSYKSVSPKYMALYESYAKLGQGQNYQSLMHIAWIQGAKKNRLSSAVKIANADRTIDGFFRIQRGNLIYMIADIEYSPSSYAGPVIYRLNEKRRFKLNEIHYLDHPKFGILARVSPVGIFE